MGLPANYSDGGKMKRLADGVHELESEAASLNSEWELVVSELGTWTGSAALRRLNIFYGICGHLMGVGLYWLSTNF